MANINGFREIVSYREMIFSLVRRELRGRYKGSILGFMWTFINPLLQLMVYTLVFSVIIPSGIDKYYLFLFVALIPWIFFSSSVVSGSSCIVAQKTMVTKIYFPREVLPISFVLTCFINMLLSLIVVFAVIIFSGIGFNLKAILFLPLIITIEFFIALGLTMLVSALTVYLRDIEHILGIVMMAWQFLTPIMYSTELVPDRYRMIFYLNPMTPIIIAYRDILYYRQIPNISTLYSAIVFGIGIVILGWALFSKLKKGFAEEL